MNIGTAFRDKADESESEGESEGHTPKGFQNKSPTKAPLDSDDEDNLSDNMEGVGLNEAEEVDKAIKELEKKSKGKSNEDWSNEIINAA